MGPFLKSAYYSDSCNSHSIESWSFIYDHFVIYLMKIVCLGGLLKFLTLSSNIKDSTLKNTQVFWYTTIKPIFLVPKKSMVLPTMQFDAWRTKLFFFQTYRFGNSDTSKKSKIPVLFIRPKIHFLIHFKNWYFFRKQEDSIQNNGVTHLIQ